MEGFINYLKTIVVEYDKENSIVTFDNEKYNINNGEEVINLFNNMSAVINKIEGVFRVNNNKIVAIDKLDELLNIELWKLCAKIYNNIIRHIAEKKQLNDTKDGIQYTYMYKYKDEFSHNIFWKHFITFILKLNFHGQNDIPFNIELVTKKFNGFKTCECIFSNLVELNKKINKLIVNDGLLINYLLNGKEKGDSVEAKERLIRNLKLEQFLSVIDLCGNDKTIEIIKFIKGKHTRGADGRVDTVYKIPEEILHLINNKLESTHQIKQTGLKGIDNTLSETLSEYNQNNELIDQQRKKFAKYGELQQQKGKQEVKDEGEPFIEQQQQKRKQVDKPSDIVDGELFVPVNQQIPTTATTTTQNENQPTVFGATNNKVGPNEKGKLNTITIEEFPSKTGGSNISRHKYLKYKSKYIQLKNK